MSEEDFDLLITCSVCKRSWLFPDAESAAQFAVAHADEHDAKSNGGNP